MGHPRTLALAGLLLLGTPLSLAAAPAVGSSPAIEPSSEPSLEPSQQRGRGNQGFGQSNSSSRSRRRTQPPVGRRAKSGNSDAPPPTPLHRLGGNRSRRNSPPSAASTRSGLGTTLTTRQPSGPPVADEALGRLYFQTADYDGNHWISYRESRSSMRLDRVGFFLIDLDRDGRIREDEFLARYRGQVESMGQFRPPIASEDLDIKRTKTPEQLLLAYDRNLSLGLELNEIEALFQDRGRDDLSAEEALEVLDTDHDKLITKLEINELFRLVDPSRPSSAGSDSSESSEQEGPEAVKARSLDELFGRAEDRSRRGSALGEPPRIEGPVTSFRRLDLDDDGSIELEDLEALQRPLDFPIRVHAVLSTLDSDRDGKVSREEFLRAMIPEDR